MFTGIIQAVAEIKGSEKKDGSLFLDIETPKGWEIAPGASIATNGACLTVREVGTSSWQTELMPETLSRTHFGMNVPEYVNLEQSLRAGDRLDGHFVLGHIDATGEITDMQADGRSRIVTITLPENDMHLVIPKGSIAINGVSLTIADITTNTISVHLVDYTLAHTTFNNAQKGEMVNIEYDMLGKYALAQKQSPDT